MGVALQLLDLPEEMLEAVVDQLIWMLEDRNNITQLGQLRFVCRRFANMHRIQSTLFESINLIASPDHFGLLSDPTLDISRLAPFVRHATLVPPLHCWTMDMYSLIKALPIGMRERTFAIDFHRAYESYSRKAQWSRDLLRSEEFKAIWARAIRALSNCTSFRFAIVDYHVLNESLEPALPDCIRKSQYDFDRLHCGVETAARVGQIFFPIALDCLGQAGVKPRRLHFGCAVKFSTLEVPLSWYKAFHSSRIQLGDLEHLVYAAVHTPIESNFEDAFLGHSTFHVQDHEFFHRKMVDSLNEVLELCNQSVQTVDCRGASFMRWTGKRLVVTPKLRQLSIGNAEISSRHLVQWIQSAPDLQRITLEYVEVSGEVGTGSDWKLIFSAIRDHSRLRAGSLQKLHLWGQQVSCTFDKDNKSDPTCWGFLTDPWADVQRTLPLYIYGDMGWDRSLAIIFSDEKPVLNPHWSNGLLNRSSLINFHNIEV